MDTFKYKVASVAANATPVKPPGLRGKRGIFDALHFIEAFETVHHHSSRI